MATDVWSYAVLLHEVFNNGKKPYDTMTNAVVVARVGEGYRLPRLPDCPETVYSLMTGCWSATPESRPAFAAVVKALAAERSAVAQDGPKERNALARSSFNSSLAGVGPSKSSSRHSATASEKAPAAPTVKPRGPAQKPVADNAYVELIGNSPTSSAPATDASDIGFADGYVEFEEEPVPAPAVIPGGDYLDVSAAMLNPEEAIADSTLD